VVYTGTDGIFKKKGAAAGSLSIHTVVVSGKKIEIAVTFPATTCGLPAQRLLIDENY